MKVSKTTLDDALRRIEELTRAVDSLRQELTLLRAVQENVKYVPYPVPTYPLPQPHWVRPSTAPWQYPVWCGGVAHGASTPVYNTMPQVT